MTPTGTIVRRTEHWIATADEETKNIFPETLDGKTIKVTHTKRLLTVCHNRTGASITFWCNLSRGKWHWHDSRDWPIRAIFRREIVNEVARLLFSNDKKEANTFLRQHLA